MSVPPPPPEALLIERKRRARVPHLSRTKAALQAGISESRWRQIETGRQRDHGRDYPAKAPADTLALMAYVVGATPGELRDAGRGDAAADLETLLANPPDPVENLMGAVRASGLTEQQKRALIERLAQE